MDNYAKLIDGNLLVENRNKEKWILRRPLAAKKFTYFAEQKSWADAEAHCVSLG